MYHFCILLSIYVHYCLFLSTIAYFVHYCIFCPLMSIFSTFVYFLRFLRFLVCTLMSIFVHFCIVLTIFVKYLVHLCLLLSTDVHPYPICPLWSTFLPVLVSQKSNIPELQCCDGCDPIFVMAL